MIRNIFRFTFSVFFWICAAIGLSLIVLLLSLYLGHKSFLKTSTQPIKQNSVLTVTLKGTYTDHVQSKGLGALLGKSASLYDLTRSIYAASEDERIKGLLLKIENPNLGKAQLQELRDALLSFKASGKLSWCYTETFGESSSGTDLYYLATACDQIWLQPLGTVNLVGINIEVPFGKESLDKLDIHPEIVQRKEYKSFIESFTREGFSKEGREAQQAIADSFLEQFVDGIAKERALNHEHVRDLIQSGPHLNRDAIKEKLVDQVNYRQNLEPTLKEKLGSHIQFVSLKNYLSTLPEEKTSGDKVALIFGEGIIQQNGKKTALGDLFISSSEAYNTFLSAAKDPHVKVIVYRINSPGGSPVASEAVYSVIKYIKDEFHKPVIISMGDAAASGGYWASVGGTKIIAQPATLTGSIGAFGGKYVISGLLEKLGVKVDSVSTSENATMYSFVHSFTPHQWQKMNALMDDVYDTFTERVAEGRGLSREQVERVARGRVWTGEQAHALGLVDQLGGLHLAIDIARQETGLKPSAGVEVFPKEKSIFEDIASLYGQEDESLQNVGVMEAILMPIRKILAFCAFVCSSNMIKVSM